MTRIDTHMQRAGIQMVFMILVVALSLGSTACTKKNAHTINLMPSPDIYVDEDIDPFSGIDMDMEAPYFGMLYASDREPVLEPGEPYYSNSRGFELRLGKASVKMGEGEFTWEEARQISLLKNRGGNYPIKLAAVDEIGILDRSFTAFTPPEKIPPDPKAPGRQFAELINAKLALSKKKMSTFMFTATRLCSAIRFLSPPSCGIILLTTAYLSLLPGLPLPKRPPTWPIWKHRYCQPTTLESCWNLSPRRPRPNGSTSSVTAPEPGLS